ncbi:hypothetical protein CYMTET_23202 [Cymbomonas tetramitiformis]|uniref:Secreted protein n=1 Tax=Cymbomonas tetramitiformis TaxID=36881 RepID=A0AAE0FYB2_9CHLO|nr:hypothetical protein CYMTET_23202 [Cymbomonas tetramitiformis]
MFKLEALVTVACLLSLVTSAQHHRFTAQDAAFATNRNAPRHLQPVDAASAFQETQDPLCETWACSCQNISNQFGTNHVRRDFAKAPLAARTWWMKQQCNTVPKPPDHMLKRALRKRVEESAPTEKDAVFPHLPQTSRGFTGKISFLTSLLASVDIHVHIVHSSFGS